MTDKEIIDGLYEIKNWKCNGDSKMHSIIRGAIDLLEQARWIPVSERVPEKTGKYLVTVKNGNVYAGVFDEVSGRFQSAVTAWQSLPTPYTESEDD